MYKIADPFIRQAAIAAVIASLFAISVQAQEYRFRNYGIEQGLPHRFAYTVAQDESGFIWVGTSTGLARFDGFDFEVNPFGDSIPPGFTVRSFTDSRNRIWYGYNSGGIAVLSGNRITVTDNREVRTMVTGIAEDRDGNILVASQQHGLLVIDDEMNTSHFQDMFAGTAITAMSVTADDQLLIGSFDGLHLYTYSPGDSPERAGRTEGLPEVAVSFLLPDDNGVFAGTRGRGLFYISKAEDGSFIASDVGESLGIGNTIIESLGRDHAGNLLVATRGQGVYRISNLFSAEEKAEIKNFTTANGLPSDIVHQSYADREGNYWFATFDGLSMLSDESLSFIRSFEEPFGNNVLSVFSDSEYFWLGGESGLLRISKLTGQRTFIGTARGLPFDMVTAITCCHENNIWIGTAENGIYKLNTGTLSASRFHFSANSLENSIHDLDHENGVLRAATSSGILEFDLVGGERKRLGTDEGMPHNFIRSVFTASDGTKWVATRGNRIVDAENSRSVGIASMELDFVAITEDHNGNLWAATNGNGLIYITQDTLIQITTSDGLYSNFCYSLITDDQGSLWAGHRLGVSRINPETYHIRTYSTESSVTGDFNFNAAHRTQDGVLLFGTSDGLVIYDNSKEKDIATSPLLNITSVQVSDDLYENIDRIILPYGSYRVRIDFIGLSYADPEKVLYQYKLDGYDLDWSDPSAQRFAYYPRLDDGNFTFLLRATNAEGISTEYPVTLAVNIDKPIWKKWYFFLIVASLAGLILFLFIKIRERNLRIEKERIERELEIRTREVVEQKAEIEVKNKDITDSINYAQRIQASILPPVSKISENFSESFVFYQPRDIVSGDFYWFDKVNDSKFLIVCADSTGHGVPGAFMSMIGTTLIKDICMRTDVNSPSDVLGTLDREVTSTLNQNVDPSGKSTDGMDITVCEFDLNTRYIRFASAMRPIMMYHKGELMYIRGSRNSIGGYVTEEKAFENQGYQLDPGDIVYLFSDGYPDQFGGPLGKKFKMVRLKNLLTDICGKTMNEQHDHILTSFNLWKGDHEQVDDVLFMGIKV
ncbi:MAG: hypothetical protein EA408_05105 [Marinilabiliales bacterium]|nr:MAG: hypothetical protein EA408_05105 [Marinilabiliales bacterium]